MRATDAERSEIEAALSGKGHSLASLEAMNVAADQAADEIQES
jgi:lambda repressor-like predicted transcriptional regulator